uniref:EOG090X0DPU n=1 Tax=Alona affinis TaxID=381656 RepID=A0A9N6ZEN1_9CRUS|nr:EOG090X0DPU [Alona affinis]
MVVKFYISMLSGNKEMKKRQMKAQLIMESKGVDFQTIDIADPGSQNERLFMQKNAPAKNGARNSVPPQFFNDEEYCGDYEGFDDANENDQLEEFLKLPRGSLPQVPVVNHNLSNFSSRDVSMEKEIVSSSQLNGSNRLNKVQANGSDLDEEEQTFDAYRSGGGGGDAPDSATNPLPSQDAEDVMEDEDNAPETAKHLTSQRAEDEMADQVQDEDGMEDDETEAPGPHEVEDKTSEDVAPDTTDPLQSQEDKADDEIPRSQQGDDFTMEEADEQQAFRQDGGGNGVAKPSDNEELGAGVEDGIVRGSAKQEQSTKPSGDEEEDEEDEEEEEEDEEEEEEPELPQEDGIG